MCHLKNSQLFAEIEYCISYVNNDTEKKHAHYIQSWLLYILINIIEKSTFFLTKILS